MSKKIVIASCAVITLLFGLNPVVAANLPAAANASQAKAAKTAATGQSVAAQKLTEANLKVCQIKEAVVQRRNDSLTKMANNMLTKFDSIATRVETHYTSKAVPAGKTISNYDVLVADIAAKRSIVQIDLDKASIDDTNFSCTSDDPKGQLTQFRTDMQAVKQALKDYRTSIKNLIVAIRSVTGTTENTTNSTTNQ